MTPLTLAFSPCPNDTFMFHALLHGLTDTGGLKFSPQLNDIDALNNFAFSGLFDVTKLSLYAFLKLRDDYSLLDTGAALGFGCGPLLVAKDLKAFRPDTTIAVPGKLTTANLLLKLWNPEIRHTVITRFDKILEGVASGVYGAGLIIHEGRFVYQSYGLKKVLDLGRWWEEKTGLPIPLGCIAVKNTSPQIEQKEIVQDVLKRSISYAINNPDQSRSYIKQHAQEMDDDVIEGHIKLYVNEFSLGLGESGKRAIATLKKMAQWANIL